MRTSIAFCVVFTVGCASHIRPPLVDHESVKVAREQHILRCDREEDVPSCTVESRSTVVNSTAATVETDTVFVGTKSTRLKSFGLDGRPLEPTPKVKSTKRGKKARYRVKTAFPPGESLLSSTGYVSLHDAYRQISAIRSRHYLLLEDDPNDVHRILVFTADPADRAEEYEFETNIVRPWRWTVAGTWRTPKEDAGEDETHDERPAVLTHSSTVSSIRAFNPDAAHLALTVDAAGPIFSAGGPVFGAGLAAAKVGSAASDTQYRLRMRLGYETSLLDFIVLGATAETDFKTITAVPSAELSTPFVFDVPLPPVGLGVGLPIRLAGASGRAVGWRLQGTLVLPLVTIMATYDRFSSLDERQLGLVLSASL